MKTDRQIVEQFSRIEKLYNENTKRFGWSDTRWHIYSKSMDTYNVMLAKCGVSPSMVFDRKGRPVFFDISWPGQHPFVYIPGAKYHLLPNDPVRYFSDSYFTPVKSWTSMAHYRNESGDLALKPEILNIVNDGHGLRDLINGGYLPR